MNSAALPEITDDDIDWACAKLGLTDIDDERAAFLKSMDTLDVSACPGSGKTTLVVAKLAVLARKWPHTTRGVCVLSHTNAARQEIQDRLGATLVGSRLLAYPHFIDTIHTFANRFLALPYLASAGIVGPTVDDEITGRYRRSVLKGKPYFILKGFLEKRHSAVEAITFEDTSMKPTLGTGNFPSGEASASYKSAFKIIERSVIEGYFKYDEMFVFADALLDAYPEIASAISERFSLVLIDEMQDTSNRQAALLKRIFDRKKGTTVIQRVGDPNQQIFKFGDGENTSDPFPNASRAISIGSSRRFGQTIATVANLFAVSPIPDGGLIGQGPKFAQQEAASTPPVAIVFPDDDCSGVLPAFAEYIAKHLSDDVLGSGDVFAVGEVHKRDDTIQAGHKHYPKAVPHYLPSYDRSQSKAGFYPATLIEYIWQGRRHARMRGDVFRAVELIAEGIGRLASILGTPNPRLRGARKHRSIRSLLSDEHEAALNVYNRLIEAVLWSKQPLTEPDWTNWQVGLIGVASALSSDHSTSSAPEFLLWSDPERYPTSGTATHSDDPNVFEAQHGRRTIRIRLSSVHGVKGQTHAATLLLHTFERSPSSDKILPFLLGSQNGKNLGPQLEKRFRQTFVALTRPTHLVGLAIRESALEGAEGHEASMSALVELGWSVIDTRQPNAD